MSASEDISFNANTQTAKKKNQFQSVDEFHENETIHEWEGQFQDKTHWVCENRNPSDSNDENVNKDNCYATWVENGTN